MSFYEYAKSDSLVSSDKSDNVVVRSFFEGDFNFIDILKSKQNLSVNVVPTNDFAQLSPKSIIKIISLFTEDESLEQSLLEYITCIIFDDNIYKDDTINSQDIEPSDAPYIRLLDQTKNYWISFTQSNFGNKKTSLISFNYDINKRKILVETKVLERIFRFLGSNVYDMSEYINVLILCMNENETDENNIKNKIINKYSKGGEDIVRIDTKYFLNLLNVPKKNNQTNIDKLDTIFDNINNFIDNIEQGSENGDSNEPFIFDVPRKYIDKDFVNPVNYKEDNKNRENRCKCGLDLYSGCTIY